MTVEMKRHDGDLLVSVDGGYAGKVEIRKDGYQNNFEFDGDLTETIVDLAKRGRSDTFLSILMERLCGLLGKGA